jgi:DNA-binding transcriptional LysR family regulator
MDIVAAMQVFVRVAEARGFTPVARETHTTQPTVSRLVAALEEHLGARLFHRSTRAVSLTDDGKQFYELARRALEAIAEAENAVGKRRTRAFGRLRLSTPVAFGRLHVVPRMPSFLELNSELQVEFVMSDSFVDLVGEGIDLAIRIGEIGDPTLIARRIGSTRRVTVASGAYLARWGEPVHPTDLVKHDCIIYTRLATGNEWHFAGPDGEIVVPVQGRYHADNSEGVREGVLGGLGVAVIPIWLFNDDELSRGAVRIILGDFEPITLPIHAVYPSRRLVPTKVRAMIEFLATEFVRDPRLSDRGFAPKRQKSETMQTRSQAPRCR